MVAMKSDNREIAIDLLQAMLFLVGHYIDDSTDEESLRKMDNACRGAFIEIMEKYGRKPTPRLYADWLFGVSSLHAMVTNTMVIKLAALVEGYDDE